jgi:hypothetical protein
VKDVIFVYEDVKAAVETSLKCGFASAGESLLVHRRLLHMEV